VTRIWFLSDTHSFHPKINVPHCDMVIHCGDESNFFKPVLNFKEAFPFFEWFSNLDIKHKIFVPGNHSTAVYNNLITPDQYPNIKFLIHEFTEIDDIRIFGSPYVPAYGRLGAYMRSRDKMYEVWNSVPDCDILITHGPPKGILDLTQDKETKKIVQVGCNSLTKKVFEKKPIIHAFGHIHEEKGCYNYGQLTRGSTTFINCSYIKNHPQGPQIQDNLILVDFN
jgi:Icc-related predicted phosphoesterase